MVRVRLRDVVDFVRRWIFSVLLSFPIVFFALNWLKRDGPSPPVVFSVCVFFALAIAIGRRASHVRREWPLREVPNSTGLSWPQALRQGGVQAAGFFALMCAQERWGFLDVPHSSSTTREIIGLTLGASVYGLLMATFLRMYTTRPPKSDT